MHCARRGVPVHTTISRPPARSSSTTSARIEVSEVAVTKSARYPLRTAASGRCVTRCAQLSGSRKWSQNEHSSFGSPLISCMLGRVTRTQACSSIDVEASAFSELFLRRVLSSISAAPCTADCARWPVTASVLSIPSMSMTSSLRFDSFQI